ncbi:MAG: HemK2/MTQ2 family protein methyltransferase [Halodesulfurarchaeum sp.]
MGDLAERRGVETTVYEPAEDSRLLAKAARDVVGPADRVLEVGTGSGFVADRLAEKTGCRILGSDVNPEACHRARERGVSVVRANLVEPFRPESFDVIVFNPPYLPEVEEAARDDWMERALTAGETGRAVIDPFLETVSCVIAPAGVVLLVASTLTDLSAVRETARSNGFVVETVREESFPFERLEVLKLTPEKLMTE